MSQTNSSIKILNEISIGHCTIRNEGQKTVEIDIEGTIGGSFWEKDNPDSKNTKEKMKAELKRISNIKADTIIVNINSYGGDINHAFSIHDLLAENTAKIVTNIHGMTASAATVIAMAGEERRMSDNSLFLVHRASLFAIGNINDIESAADDLKKVDDRIINLYAKVTGKSKDEITDLIDRNNGYGEWLSPEEAKQYNFVTDIFEPRKIAAMFSTDILSKFNLPELPENHRLKSNVGDVSGGNEVIDWVTIDNLEHNQPPQIQLSQTSNQARVNPDNLEHNIEADKMEIAPGHVDWNSINSLPHNKEVD